MIKAIIFDVDGTLLDSFESNLEFFQNEMRLAGYRPPTREEYKPLLLAARKLGVQPEECVYVGDVENDMKAAEAAGMKFILYSIDGTNEAGACISDFRELPKLIGALN